MTAPFDLTLPGPERLRAAALAAPWTDFLYVPGRGFTSPIEPGLYRSSFVIAPGEGRAVRVSSFVVPAFGGELCRIRFEPLVSFRLENLGSFFEPARRGVVYAMSPDRTGALTPSPGRPGWSYDGPTLKPRLERVARAALIRERVTGGSADGAFSWTADRGLALTAADGNPVLLLATADEDEQVIFAPRPGLYAALINPAAPTAPGATLKDLLGYGDRPDLKVKVEMIPLPSGERAG